MVPAPAVDRILCGGHTRSNTHAGTLATRGRAPKIVRFLPRFG